MTTWANPIDPGLVSMQRALGDYFTLLTPDSLEHCIDASILGCHRVTLLTPDEVPSFASFDPVARFCASAPALVW